MSPLPEKSVAHSIQPNPALRCPTTLNTTSLKLSTSTACTARPANVSLTQIIVPKAVAPNGATVPTQATTPPTPASRQISSVPAKNVKIVYKNVAICSGAANGGGGTLATNIKPVRTGAVQMIAKPKPQPQAETTSPVKPMITIKLEPVSTEKATINNNSIVIASPKDQAIYKPKPSSQPETKLPAKATITIKSEPITTNSKILITSPKELAVRQILSKISEPQPQSTPPGTSSRVASGHPPSPAARHEYRELFAALLKIKDASMVARVMAAINGATPPPPHTASTLCSRCAKRTQNDTQKCASTQTHIMPDWRRRLNTPIVRGGDAVAGTNESRPPVKSRKRRRREPHAVKTSDGVVAGEMTDTSESVGSMRTTKTTAVPAKRIAVSVHTPHATPVVPQQQQQHPHSQLPSSSAVLTTPAPSPSLTANNTASPSAPSASNSDLRLSVDSISSNQLFGSIQLGDIDEYASTLSPQRFVEDIIAKLDRSNERSVAERVKQKMAQEYRTLKCFDPESGLLPIHVAALNGELHRIMRLVKILKFLQIDLNDESLLAQDVDEHGDLLQNSVLHCAVDSLAPTAGAIVDHLLANGADPLLLNRHDDNVLHHAVKNTDNVALFVTLLAHLERRGAATTLATIAACNQDGLAVIHLIVSQRKVAFLEALLATIDRCRTADANANATAGEPPEATTTATTTNLSAAALREHIDRFDRLPVDGASAWRPRMWPAKSALLNQPERCTGRTALLRAVLQRDCERIVLLLLAHHADPRVSDFAGVDCVFAACNGDDDEAAAAAAGRNGNGGKMDGGGSPPPLGVCIQKTIVLLEYMEGSRKVRNGGRASNAAAWPVVLMKLPVQNAAELKPKRAYKRRKMAADVEVAMRE